MKFNELDTVVVVNDHQDEGITKGEIGVVVLVHTDPNEAYEVEFVDDEGATIAQLVLLPEELEKYNG